MLCAACHAPLQPIHGALACVTSGCPLFGAPMAGCCNGVSTDGLDAGAEADAVDVPDEEDLEPATPGRPR